MLWRTMLWSLSAASLCISQAVADEAQIVVDPFRPAAIVAEEVPVVPAELVARLRQYQSVRAAAFQGWDPAGRGLLVQTRFGDTAQLHRVYTPGGRREQVTFFAEPTRGRPLPRATDGAVLVMMSEGGNENDQIHLFYPAQGEATRLTDGRSRNLLYAISRDGQRIAFGSNRRNQRDTDLYLIDPRRADSLLPLMETDGEFWIVEDLAPGGKKALLMRKYVSINENYPALLTWNEREVDGQRQATDVKQVAIAPPEPAGGKVAVGAMAFSADGAHAWLCTDARGEFRELARLDLKTQEYHWAAPGLEGDVEEIAVEPTSGKVAFTINREGASELYLLEKETPQRLELPRGIISGIAFSPRGGHLGFTLSQPDCPSEVYSLQLQANVERLDVPEECEVAPGLVRWTFSEVGGLDRSQFTTAQAIRFPSFDGRQIPADYYRPRTANPQRKAPVLIHIHGGPESQSRPYFSGSDQFYVNELGIAVIKPNVRGSNGYGKTYLLLDNAEKREDSVRDIGALLDWIAAQPELDANRVAVIGGSYGGYMVLSSLMNFPDRIKAGVDIVGVTSFDSFLKNTSAYRRDLRRAEYGDERDPKMQAVFARIDPAQNAHRIRSALLVAHGRNDPRVPFSEAEQIVAAVRRNGQKPWTVYADNEGHGFAKKANADYLTAVTVLFLQEHLGE